MLVSFIVAADQGGVIGAGGGLPWRLPADLRRFKSLTMGHHLIVGRKTFEAIGRPLPGRKMVVVSRQEGTVADGVQAASSPETALALARAAGESEAFVAGGGEIYRALLPWADRVYLTRVEAHFAGDTFFPELDPAVWWMVSREDHPAEDEHAVPHSFQLWERLSRAPAPRR